MPATAIMSLHCPGFFQDGCICEQVRVFLLVVATPQNSHQGESVSELSPDRLLGRVVASAGRGAQRLLREQGDAGDLGTRGATRKRLH